MKTIYPIGSLYLTTNSANPANIFGFGTWEQIKDASIVGAGGSYAVGNTYGSNTIKLNVNQMPAHTHSMGSVSGTTSSAGNHTHSHSLYGSTNTVSVQHKHNVPIATSASSGAGTFVANFGPGGTLGTTSNTTTSHSHSVSISGSISSSGNHSHTFDLSGANIGSAGGNADINILNKSLAVYIWKRIS